MAHAAFPQTPAAPDPRWFFKNFCWTFLSGRFLLHRRTETGIVCPALPVPLLPGRHRSLFWLKWLQETNGLLGGKVTIWREGGTSSLRLNTDEEEEDSGKARVRIKLSLTEVCSCESLSRGKSRERAGRETPLARDGVRREKGDCLEKQAGKT